MSFNLPCVPLLPPLPPALSASSFPPSYFFSPLVLHTFFYSIILSTLCFLLKVEQKKTGSSVSPIFPFQFSLSAERLKACGRGFFLTCEQDRGHFVLGQEEGKRERRVKKSVGKVNREKLVGGWEQWSRRGDVAEGGGGVAKMPET